MADFTEQMAELAEQGVTLFVVEDEDTERRVLNELWAEECKLKEKGYTHTYGPMGMDMPLDLEAWYRVGVLCINGVNVRPMKGSVYDVGEMD